MIAHVQYNVRHLLLYSIFSSSKSYRNLDICYFILYFLTRNHIEIEMARKYTDGFDMDLVCIVMYYQDTKERG